jgi:hypothetical protein
MVAVGLRAAHMKVSSARGQCKDGLMAAGCSVRGLGKVLRESLGGAFL